jgi:hypothetical protein
MHAAARAAQGRLHLGLIIGVLSWVLGGQAG